MGELSTYEKLVKLFRSSVYRLVLPIYLWSIGYKSLEEYTEAVYLNEKSYWESREKE
jgi:hypothetical protein